MSKKVSYALDVSSDNVKEVLRAINKLRCSIVNVKPIDKKYDKAEFTINVEMREKNENSVCDEFNELKNNDLVVLFWCTDRWNSWKIRWWPSWWYRWV